MKKILVITGTRADYGIYHPILKALENESEFKCELLVTGMHLSPYFGDTINDIKNDGFKIASTVDMLLHGSTHSNMAKSIGLGILGMAQSFESLKPDYVVLLGDRGEMLAAAIVASHMNIPVLHFHGGEVSGTIDESVRHAISKLSHVHFAATEASKERLVRLGEDSWRIHVVGAPRIETILNTDLPKFDVINKKYELNIYRKYMLLLYHPVTTEHAKIDEEIREILDAVLGSDMDIICILPNSDAGNQKIIDVYKEYSHHKHLKFVANFSQLDYLSILMSAEVMVGNSSSGIIEAASFKKPVINIGTRQNRRERSGNVIDVSANKQAIMDALKKINTKEFSDKLDRVSNVYGEGNTSKKVIEVLKKLVVDKRLLQKTITY